jgi:hypothetical protein
MHSSSLLVLSNADHGTPVIFAPADAPQINLRFIRTDGFDSTVGIILIQFISLCNCRWSFDTVDSCSCHGWSQWHCSLLFVVPILPMVTLTLSVVAVDQQPDLLASLSACCFMDGHIGTVRISRPFPVWWLH